MEPKFKLGDRIMIVNSGWTYKKGLFGTVIAVKDALPNERQSYVITVDNTDQINYYYEDALEFGTEAARLLYV